MKGSGISHGALTVVNALPSGCGAALGVDLQVKVDAEVETTGRGYRALPDTALFREIIYGIGRSASFENLKALFTVYSDLPSRAGMKSSSSVANAAILAVSNALKLELSVADVLRLNVEASRRAGVTFTGALDDAAACLIGGVQVSNNLDDKILKSYFSEAEAAIFLLPDGVTRPDNLLSKTETLKELSRTAFRLALDGRYHEAINLNGSMCASALGYDYQPIIEAWRGGATACGLTGNGPAYSLLTTEDKKEYLATKWEKYGRVIMCNSRLQEAE